MTSELKYMFENQSNDNQTKDDRNDSADNFNKKRENSFKKHHSTTF